MPGRRAGRSECDTPREFKNLGRSRARADWPAAGAAPSGGGVKKLQSPGKEVTRVMRHGAHASMRFCGLSKGVVHGLHRVNREGTRPVRAPTTAERKKEGEMAEPFLGIE